MLTCNSRLIAQLDFAGLETNGGEGPGSEGGRRVRRWSDAVLFIHVPQDPSWKEDILGKGEGEAFYAKGELLLASACKYRSFGRYWPI